MALRVLLADDHQILRQGLRALLEREGLTVVAEAADGRLAVEAARTHEPDVAVLDLSMPHLNGLDAAREILQVSPRTAIVMLTMHLEDHQVIAALRAGIRGYVVKSQAADALVEAIREVSRGGTYLTPKVAHVLVGAFVAGAETPVDPLSPRDRQVLQLIAEGETTKEIAGSLGLTVKTAESYRARLMEKLEIHDTAGLVRYAIRQGLIEP